MSLQLNTQRLYTVNEVAHILKVSPRTVQRRIRDGLLRGTKPPGSLEWRIHPDALSAYVQCDPTGGDAAPPVATPRHYSGIDIEGEMRRRVDAIAADLADVGADLDPLALFWLEALGYVVDLETGAVSEGA